MTSLNVAFGQSYQRCNDTAIQTVIRMLNYIRVAAALRVRKLQDLLSAGLLILTVNDEKPRSRVMPRSLLWGCLSRAAVESFVDRAATAR